MTWVFFESDVRGFERLVLLALADEADDDGAECYPSMRRIAHKAGIGVGTVPAVLLRLEQAGVLVIERPERKGRGAVYRYRLQMQKGSAAEHSSDELTRGKVQERAAPVAKTARTQDPRPSPSRDSDQSEGESTIEARRLCELLATSIESHRAGSDRPAVTERWVRDMRLLLERGPQGIAKPESIEPARVERCISFVFRNLADPSGDGFCWADQVRSPTALRRHWTRIRDAARALDRARFADLTRNDEGRLAEKSSEATSLLRDDDCVLCGGTTWLPEDDEALIFDGPSNVARPCPRCRPNQAIANTQGDTR